MALLTRRAVPVNTNVASVPAGSFVVPGSPGPGSDNGTRVGFVGVVFAVNGRITTLPTSAGGSAITTWSSNETGAAVSIIAVIMLRLYVAAVASSSTQTPVASCACGCSCGRVAKRCRMPATNDDVSTITTIPVVAPVTTCSRRRDGTSVGSVCTIRPSNVDTPASASWSVCASISSISGLGEVKAIGSLGVVAGLDGHPATITAGCVSSAAASHSCC